MNEKDLDTNHFDWYQGLFVFLSGSQKFLLAIELFFGDVPFSQFDSSGYPKRIRPMKLCLIYRSKAWLPSK